MKRQVCTMHADEKTKSRACQNDFCLVMVIISWWLKNAMVKLSSCRCFKLEEAEVMTANESQMNALMAFQFPPQNNSTLCFVQETLSVLHQFRHEFITQFVEFRIRFLPKNFIMMMMNDE